MIRIATVVMLLGAAVIGTFVDRAAYEGVNSGWLVPLIFGIGVFNALVVLPGTSKVRTVTVIGAFVALLIPSSRALLLGLFWLVWPPFYLLVWALADSTVDDEGNIHGAERADVLSPARIKGAALIVAVAIGSIAYKLILYGQLQQTAALFVGIPTILAIVVVLFGSPRTAVGVACKAVTVGLLVSFLFLGEGVLCVVMSAPIFYAVAVAVAAGISAARRRRIDDPRRTMYSSLVLLAVLVSSLEGVSGSLSLDRREFIATTKVVPAPALEIQRAVLEQPRFERIMPFQLRAGFPRPTAVRIEAGARRWIILMRGGETRIDGMEPREGNLVLELEAVQPGLVRWRAVSDNSHMTHFLTWRSATVTWEAVDAHSTKVTWTLQYDRGLDPAWYFGPWERYVARIAAGYLIDAVATPR